MNFYKLLPQAVFMAMIASQFTAHAGSDANNIYLYHNNSVVYADLASRVDSIAWEEGKTRVTLYSPDKDVVYTSALGEVDSIAFSFTPPVADLLDVQFTDDGQAYDASPLKCPIEVIGENDRISTRYNARYGRYSAIFDNAWGTGSLGENPSYCKVDFKDNTALLEGLKSGHTLETVFKASYTPPIADAEAKWFAAHEQGGTGLMICKKANGKNGGNEITFLPNVSTNGGSSWKWATSGIVPEPETYYHVVGVWNKEEGKAYIYVNGELCNTVAAEGEFHLNPDKTNSWYMALGCDAGAPDGQFGGNWELVTAKIYDTPLSAYDVEGIYSQLKADTDVPVADLLDVEFNADGTASDISPMSNTVQTFQSDAMYTYFNSDFGRYAARFDNTYGGTTSAYYKVDYQNNAAFIDALASGHSLECVVMADYPGTIAENDVEAKFFTSHEAGGTGLMVCKKANGKNGTQEWTFLPNVSTNGGSSWKWATSGIVPEKGTYYHLVGVWDKEAKEARIYVNGKLCNTVAAEGDLHFPAAQYRWFGIGCDAGPSAQLGWKGDVVLARAYTTPLNARQVEVLYGEVADAQQSSEPRMIEDVDYYSGVGVAPGIQYEVRGNGFQEGDRLELMAMSAGAEPIGVETILTAAGIAIVIPENLVTGLYRMTLHRGDKTQELGITRLNVLATMPKAAHVIAHRGYWNTEGSAQNSRASLRKAIELECYGSETDVWLTTDGVLMVNHDASFGGVTIKDATSDRCKQLTLSNGEKMPELGDLLDIVKEADNDTKLIIEIKDHGNAALNRAAGSAAVAAVKAAGLQDKVEYISFSDYACVQVIADDPDAQVAYLTGGVTPAVLHSKKYTGLDYHMAEFRNHPEWITQAHNLGMTVNVWTVTSVSDLCEFMNKGVDYVTTDAPVTALELRDYYLAHEGEGSGEEPEQPEIKDPEFPDFPTPDPGLPKADLLDIVFHMDGTATDISPMQNYVTSFTDGIEVSAREEFGRCGVHFSNPFSGTATGYYRVDYAGNEAMLNGLADGHTLECVVSADDMKNAEAKFFSSHAAGGTGLMICNDGGGRGGNFITFLPNVSENGASTWRWAISDITPELGKFYHILGVYNKEEGKAYLYINGTLAGEADAPGNFIHSGDKWFAIGGDPEGNAAKQAWNGDVVIARIYNEPLSAEDAKGLYKAAFGITE